MRKYITAVRAAFANLRQFALNFAMQMLAMPIAALVLLYIYRTISGDGSLGTYSALRLSLYLIGVAVSMQVAWPAFTVMWESWEQINKGDLANYLCRPVDYLWLRYARKLAPALVMAGCASIVHAVVQLLQKTWSPLATLQFGLATLLSFSLWFMFWFAMGAVSFWWERPFGARDIMWNVSALLSGQLLPVDLFHPALQAVIKWLPFQGMAYVPAGLFAGSLTGSAALTALAQQAVWLVALTVLARSLWAAGVRTFDGRGG